MERPGVRQVLEGSGEQGKMEKTGCKIIRGAPTTLVVKGLMMMMMMISASFFLLLLSIFLLSPEEDLVSKALLCLYHRSSSIGEYSFLFLSLEGFCFSLFSFRSHDASYDVKLFSVVASHIYLNAICIVIYTCPLTH